ncbi:MAG: alpha/beta fold hydrolase [Bacteroidota bacterium]
MTKHGPLSIARFSAILLLSLVFTQVATAQSVIDTMLVMSDGVKLDALYVLPNTPPPAGGYPAILLVHGFAGSKNNNRSLAISFAALGYAATAYSVRGQGNSEGLFEFFTAPRILDDLQENIDFTKQLRGVNAERVAVVGASQGGLHAWNAAAYNMGVRCVGSIIANGRAEENWLENDALNWTFAIATMTPDVRFEPTVATLLRVARESGNYTEIRPYLRDHSTNSFESGVSTPTAIFVSYHDGFFNQNAALRQFDAISAPKRIVLYPGGHALPPDPAQEQYVLGVLDRWLGFWLKDDASLATVASPDSEVVFFDGGTGEARSYSASDTDQWLQPGDPLPSGMYRTTLYFDARDLTSSRSINRSEYAIPYVNVLGSTPISFRTQPLLSPITILPPPGKAYLRVNATGKHYQMNVTLYDVDPVTGRRTPMCRGHRQSLATIGERGMDFELTGLLHTVKAGHLIEALVHAGTALIPDQTLNFGNYVLGPVDPSINTFIIGGDYPSSISFYTLGEPVGVEGLADRPYFGDEQMRLLPAWPNPSGASTTISFELRSGMDIRLTVHDMIGREVATLAEGYMEKGRYSAVLSSSLPNGMYVYRLSATSSMLQDKLLIMH